MKPIFREVNLAHHIGRAIHLIDAHCQEVVGQGKKYNPDIDYQMCIRDSLSPLIIRCFGILMRAGKFDTPPEELMQPGVKLQIVYTSPIAKAQQQVEEMCIRDSHYNAHDMRNT